jgi:predicted ester cyclase
VRGAIELVRNAFDQFTETILDIIIEGDKAVTRYVASGVHTGHYFDLPPTGALVSVDEISIFHVRNRLVLEQWCFGQMRE